MMTVLRQRKTSRKSSKTARSAATSSRAGTSSTCACQPSPHQGWHSIATRFRKSLPLRRTAAKRAQVTRRNLETVCSPKVPTGRIHRRTEVLTGSDETPFLLAIPSLKARLRMKALQWSKVSTKDLLKGKIYRCTKLRLRSLFLYVALRILYKSDKRKGKFQQG